MLDLNPLPPGKPVNLPSGITFQTYGDIILIAEFVNVFHDLLAPKETLHVSIGILFFVFVSLRLFLLYCLTLLCVGGRGENWKIIIILFYLI